MTTDPTDPDARSGRPEQHGPEMDDTQVEATGQLADELPPVTGNDRDADGED